MNRVTHEIVDCRGFKIVKSWPWAQDENKNDNHELKTRDEKNWGFMVCRPADSMKKGDQYTKEKLYGVIGPIQSHSVIETCLGIHLVEPNSLQSALAQFVLSCGLSIVEKARVEIGDTVVVSGGNPLAISVLVAAKAQSIKTICLVSSLEMEASQRCEKEKLADEVIVFEYNSSFDVKFNEAIMSPAGKIVYADTTGDPGVVYSMAKRLEKFGTLVFCRQEASKSVLLNLLAVHHLKSAKFIYWSRPETLEEALIRQECCRRAARLLNYKRVSDFISDNV